MAQVPTSLSLALTEVLAKAAATGLTQKEVAERIVTRSRRRRAPSAHPDESVLVGRWQRNLSNWKTAKSLPATFDDLKVAVSVIAPDTLEDYWFGLWAQARGGPIVPQGDEKHARKHAFSFVPHSPHGRIYGDRHGGNVYLRKQLPLDAEVILGGAGSVCSILMIDIDDLTQINKRCETDVGDDVLQATNLQLAENPAVWVNGRCGDDTFFAVVPNLGRDDVRLVAHKTCERFRGNAWDELEAELHVTCSIGFAHFRVDEPAEDAVARAVTGFHRAKKEGGNRALQGPRRIPPLLRDPAALRAAPIAPGATSERTVPPRPSAVANLITRMPGRTWNFS